MSTTTKNTFGTHSTKISKHFNGRALCPDLLQALWMQYLPEEDKQFHVVYKMIDKTNNWEYVGRYNAKSYRKFATYTGSGSLLRYMISQKGIQNFEFHFIAFFDNKDDANKLEGALVNKHYLQTANTYNLCSGGSNDTNWAERKHFIHCPKTNRTFSVYKSAAKKLVEELNFEWGFSDEDKQRVRFTENKQLAAISKKYIKLMKDDGQGNVDFIEAYSDKVQNYIHLGWEFSSTRVWMHLPNQDPNHVWERGVDWKQPGTNNMDAIKDMFDKGWICGRPPCYAGSKTIKNVKRSLKNKEVA